MATVSDPKAFKPTYIAALVGPVSQILTALSVEGDCGVFYSQGAGKVIMYSFKWL